MLVVWQTNLSLHTSMGMCLIEFREVFDIKSSLQAYILESNTINVRNRSLTHVSENLAGDCHPQADFEEARAVGRHSTGQVRAGSSRCGATIHFTDCLPAVLESRTSATPLDLRAPRQAALPFSWSLTCTGTSSLTQAARSHHTDTIR